MQKEKKEKNIINFMCFNKFLSCIGFGILIFDGFRSQSIEIKEFLFLGLYGA